ncbi:MAG: Spy/CpxP family protein refolding chaperone, partial [Mariprofundus sp.]
HVATASPDKFGSGFGDGKRLERMAEKLDLTDAQRQQLKQIHRSKRAEGMQIHDAMQDNREALLKLNPAESDYSNRVARLAGGQGDLVKQMIIHKSGVRAQVSAILTPAQRKKAAELKKNRRHGGKHGFRQHRREGRS